MHVYVAAHVRVLFVSVHCVVCGQHCERELDLQERTSCPAAQSDPDGPFCAADLYHWTQTHAKPHLAPPPTMHPVCNAPCAHHETCPASPGALSASSRASRHSSQSFHSRSTARSQEREREKSASRLLDVASAGSVLFYMLHGREPFPADGDEMIKSWRSKDSSGIAWPYHGVPSPCLPPLFVRDLSVLFQGGSLAYLERAVSG